jgi:nucleoid-associated protein YgaU
MQQIERYGVIALVFLLVTIVAVSFWGDNKSPGFWSRLTGRGSAQKMEIAKNAATAERAVDNALPLTNNPSAGPVDTQAPPATAFAPIQAQPQTAETAIANANPTPGEVHPSGNGMMPTATPAPQNPIVFAPAAAPAPAPVATALKTEPAAPKAAGGAPRTKAAAGTSGSTTEYVVQKGDSLASIAQKHLGNSSRWTEIQSLNGGIQPKALRVGAKLKLPATTTAKTTLDRSAPRAEPSASKKSAPAASSSAPAGTIYVVRSGDTLSTIAEKKLGSADRWKDIVSANPGLDPHKILVGQALKLPAGEGRDTRSMVAAAAQPSESNSSGKPHVR